MPGAAAPGIEKQHSEKRRKPNRILMIARLPVLYNFGGFAMLLMPITCRLCREIFHICRCCYRGQAYCSGLCRILRKRQKHRQAQRRCRQTPKGKKAHREAENRRRQKLAGRKTEINMDDATSTVRLRWFITMAIFAHLLCSKMKSGFEKPRCRFCGVCGQVVDRFPPRP